MTTTMFRDEVQPVADEYERKGWLHKLHDQHGIEWRELTPLGRTPPASGHGEDIQTYSWRKK